jgi:CHAT domain-containing protein/tetratricopeptide (TPR) repeat protein
MGPPATWSQLRSERFGVTSMMAKASWWRPVPLSLRVILLFCVALPTGLTHGGSTAQEAPAGPGAQFPEGDLAKAMTLTLFRSGALGKYRAGEYADLAKIASRLLNEENGAAGPGRTVLDDPGIVDLFLVGQLRTGDLAGATRLLHRQREPEPRDAGSYYRLALSYLARGLQLPAFSLLEEAARQPIGAAAIRAATDLLRSVPPPDWGDPRRVDELAVFAAEYQPLQRALAADRVKALVRYHIPIAGRARARVLEGNLPNPGEAVVPNAGAATKYSADLLTLTQGRIDTRFMLADAMRLFHGKDNAGAAAKLEAALVTSRHALTTRLEADAQGLMGLVSYQAGDPKRGVERLITAGEQYHGLGDEKSLAKVLRFCREALRSVGIDQSLSYVMKALDLALGELPDEDRLARDPEFYSARANRALRDERDVPKAIDELRRAMIVRPSQMKYHANLAILISQQAGTLAEAPDSEARADSMRVVAMILVDRSLKIDPDSGPAQELLKSLTKLVEGRSAPLSTHNPLALERFDIAGEHFRKQQFNEAIAEYEKALKADPRFVEARIFLGDCYFQLRKYEDAAAHYELAIRVDPRHQMGQRFLVDAYTKFDPPRLHVAEKLPEGNLPRRCNELRVALRTSPNSSKELYQLGLVYLSRHMPLPAKYYFDRALLHTGEDAEMVINILRGKAWSTWADSTDPDLYWQMLTLVLEDGECRQAFLKDTDGAIERLGFAVSGTIKAQLRSVDLDVMLWAWNHLPEPTTLEYSDRGHEQGRPEFDQAKLSWSQGDWDAALKHARRAIAAAPGAGPSYILASFMCIKTGLHFLALEYLQEAERLGVSTPDTDVARGLLQILVGDHVGAVTSFGKLAKREPRQFSAGAVKKLSERLTTSRGAMITSGVPDSTAGSGGSMVVASNTATSSWPQLVRGDGPPTLRLAPNINAGKLRDYLLRVAGIERPDQLEHLAKATKAQEYVERLPTLRPIALAEGKPQKTRAIQELPAGKRRDVALMMHMFATQSFKREGDLAQALIYAELELENALLIPKSAPPDGYACYQKYIGDAYLDAAELRILGGEYVAAKADLERAEQKYSEAESERRQLGADVSEIEKLTDTGFFGAINSVSYLLDVASLELGEPLQRKWPHLSLIEKEFPDVRLSAMAWPGLAQPQAHSPPEELDRELHGVRWLIQAIAPLDPAFQRIFYVQAIIRKGLICRDLGMYQSALAYFEESRKTNADPGKGLFGSQGRRATELLISYALIASTHTLMGQIDVAIDNLTQALRVAIGHRSDSHVDRLRAEDTIDPSLTWKILASLGALLRERASGAADPQARLASLELSVGRYRQALAVVETTRQKQRAESLRLEEQARVGYTGGKAGLYRDAFEVLRALHSAAPGQSYDREMIECAERAKSQALVELLRERGVEFPGGGVASVSAAAMLDALAASNTVAVEYYYTDQTAYALCYGGPRRTLVIAELGDGDKPLAPAELERRAMTLRASLSDLTKSVDQINSESEAFYHILFPGPVHQALRDASDLVIVPHGSLHLLPLAALWDGQGYLYQSKRLAVAPSTSVLLYAKDRRRELDGRGAAAAGNGPALLSVINPGGSASLRRITQRQESDLPRIFPSPPSEYYARSALPVTRLAAQMTRDRFLAEAGRFDYVHVFSHAQFLTGYPLNSFIEMAGGRLTAADLYEAIRAQHGFQIKARLVTLAACETGEGHVASGDEVLGLPRALLHAGATAMVVTLWRADAGFTDRLMVRLYAKLHRGGTGTAEALREAVEETIARGREEGYAHPYYWAPFVLIGDLQ